MSRYNSSFAYRISLASASAHDLGPGVAEALASGKQASSASCARCGLTVISDGKDRIRVGYLGSAPRSIRIEDFVLCDYPCGWEV